MAKQKSIWSCGECGHTQPKWSGSCSSCGKWNTFAEESQAEEKRFGKENLSKPLCIAEIPPTQFRRFSTQMTEFDRVLGGGIVAGSLILVGGDPGIGKSTLMLQVAEQLAAQNFTVLYVSGEESAEQTSLRAQRLRVRSKRLFLLSETLFSHIKIQIEELKPHVVIADSIQILYKNEISSAPGSVPQVREIAIEMMHLAKEMNIAIFLIGHVTKSGEIAGPKILEHLVDTVLDFEGDRQHGFRLLRASKNRFGPTDDIALFQMGAEGLKEITNPSLLFLEERKEGISGSAIIPTIEGTRAFLIEVQALVAAAGYSTSSRRSTGLDQNRLALLLAVLEKRMGYQLHHCDVFVSVAGGLKIVEPAIDLGILMAIASSFCNKALDPQTVVIGEVGLGGEVRSVPRIENRIKEAIHMGFRQCILPRRNLRGLPQELFQKIALHGIDVVEEAIDVLINQRSSQSLPALSGAGVGSLERT